MTKEELTHVILGKQLICDFDSKDFVDWAVTIMQQGYESDSLFILAGLDNERTEVREKYFYDSVRDLKIDINKTNQELIEIYAKSVAGKAVNNEIDIEDAFRKMCTIACETDYDRRYIGFYIIEEDLECLEYANRTSFTTDLTLVNYKEYIKNEFQIFLEMFEITIPDSERGKYYCTDCESLIRIKAEVRYQLKQPFKYETNVCENCGSENLKYPEDQITKIKLIEKYKYLYL